MGSRHSASCVLHGPDARGVNLRTQARTIAKRGSRRGNARSLRELSEKEKKKPDRSGLRSEIDRQYST